MTKKEHLSILYRVPCIRALDQSHIQNVTTYNGNNLKKNKKIHRIGEKNYGFMTKPKKLNVQKMFFNGDFISATEQQFYLNLGINSKQCHLRTPSIW